MVRAPTLTTGIRAHIMGPRSAGNSPPFSSTPPRPPDLDEVRRKRIQIAKEQVAERTAAWRRELETTMASFQSELLNELRQFRLELTAQVMEPSVPTSSVPIISLPMTQPVSSGPQLGTIDCYKPPPPPPATAGPYPCGYELQQRPPPPPRPSVTVHALGESPSPAYMRYTYHSLSLNGDCGDVKLTGFDKKLDVEEGENSDKMVKVNSGVGIEFHELESVSAKQDKGGLIEDKQQLINGMLEFHALQLFDKMPNPEGLCDARRTGLCNAGRTIMAPMSIRDKGGGLATHCDIVDASDCIRDKEALAATLENSPNSIQEARSTLLSLYVYDAGLSETNVKTGWLKLDSEMAICSADAQSGAKRVIRCLQLCQCEIKDTKAFCKEAFDGLGGLTSTSLSQVLTMLKLNFPDVRRAFESIMSCLLKLYHNCLNGKVGEEIWPPAEWIEKMNGDADNSFGNRSTREIKLDNFLVATGLAYDTDSFDMAPLGSSEMVNTRSNKRQMVTSLSLMKILFSKVLRMKTDENSQAPILRWLIRCLLLCDCKKDVPTLVGTLNAWLNDNILCLSVGNKLEKVSLFFADMLDKIGHEWLLKKYAAVRFVSKDEKYLVLGSKDGDICVVNVKKMEHELVELGHHISSQGVVNLLEQVALTGMGKLRDGIFLFPGGFIYDNQACLATIMAKQLPKAACHSIFFKLILAILRQESSDALRRWQYALLLSYFLYFQHKLDLDIPSTVLQFLLLDAQESEDLDPQKINREQAEVVHANFSILRNEAQSILDSAIKDANQGSEIRDDDVRNISIIIALQKHTRFDCVRGIKTVKDSMADFKQESGCILFIQNLFNMLGDESHAWLRELMFDNESHIIPTGAIAIRLVCHFGADLPVTNSYSHMDHSEMCWLHTWLICCLLFCDCRKKALPLAGKGKLKEMAALFNWFLCASSEFGTLALNAWLNGNFLFLRLENKLQKMKLVLADKLKKLDTIVKMMFVDNWESWKYLIIAADVKAIAARVSYGGLSELVASEYFSCSVGPIIAGEMGVHGYKPSVLMDMLAGWLHVALRDKELIKANSTYESVTAARVHFDQFKAFIRGVHILLRI